MERRLKHCRDSYSHCLWSKKEKVWESGKFYTFYNLKKILICLGFVYCMNNFHFMCSSDPIVYVVRK